MICTSLFLSVFLTTQPPETGSTHEQIVHDQHLQKPNATLIDLHNPFLYYFKTKISLRYDFKHVAVKLSQPAGDESHFQDLEIARRLAGGFLILRTEGELQGPEQLYSMIEALASKDSVRIASPIFLSAEDQLLIVSDEILVQFKNDRDLESLNRIVADHNIDSAEHQAWSTLPGSFKLRSQSRNGFEILNQANSLASREDFRFAEPNMIFTGRNDEAPNDPLFGLCWGLHNTGEGSAVEDVDMDILEAWNITAGNPEVKVLVIDTGTEQSHPDLNQLPGKDFTGEPQLQGGPGNECDKHGTPVSGCISAIINNSLGGVGAAPESYTVSARCFVSNVPCDGGWSAVYSWTADALDWGASEGIRISNNSNSYGGTSSAVTALYLSTKKTAGMVHFSSSGNSSSTEINFPANLSTVNAIGAIDNTGSLAAFSNYGEDQALTAPGQGILSTDETGANGYVSGDYVSINGTSFASPYAAACAALLLSVNSTLTAEEVESILFDTAVDLGQPGFDEEFGHGLVNANSALLVAIESLCPADLNDDYAVNLSDLLVVLSSWGENKSGDTNGDGQTDYQDLLALISDWGNCFP